MYKLMFHPKWKNYFNELHSEIRKQVAKKIKKIKEGIKCRGLHGTSLQVAEVGQYRIVFHSNEKEKVRIIYYVGKHKDYDKWCGIRK